MDVAIVGGGVAGCYCAYRLANAWPDKDIHLFEQSDRIGGRLWSVPLQGFAASPAEIGGMYFKQHHTHVRELVRHLGLTPEPVKYDRKHQFLRGKYFNDEAYTSDDGVPFVLKGEEKGKQPYALLAYALEKMAPGATDLWPIRRKPPRSPQATLRRLRIMRHEGRPLHECGFWNVLADRVSNEAYTILTQVFGSIALFRNVNAFDGIWNLMHEMGEGSAFRISGGYQELPLALQKQAEARKVEFHLDHRLRSIRREDDAFRLYFRTEAGESYHVMHANAVILALPRRALQLVSLHRDLFQDIGEFIYERDQAVIPMRSCKLFMTFDTPWWDKSKAGPGFLGAHDVAVAFTDLPMQQCYYFGSPAPAEPALLMAAYADDVAPSFWRPLVDPADSTYKNPVEDPEDAKLLCGSEAMAASARRQLSQMHRDTKTPDPTGITFFDWGCDPYGAAWHGWAPRFRSWETRPRMRRPNPALDLFICGEAYSQRNGWVEGAINSAEKTLEHLLQDRPQWMTDYPDFQFEIDDTGGEFMAKPLEELLEALSQSLPLQRAYMRAPEAIMKAFGLGRREIEWMTNGKVDDIKDELGGGVSVSFFIFANRAVDE